MSSAALARVEAPVRGPRLHRLSVNQYHRMIEAGILHKKSKVELLEGLLGEKMTHHPPSASAISRLTPLLAKLLPEGWLVRVQLPITTADSEPEPDFTIAVGSSEDYDRRHPTPKEIALVIEVSDSSLSLDRNLMARIYARGRIPTYWIVNIPDRQLEVHTRPLSGKNPRYREKTIIPESGSVSLTLGKGIVGPIAVASILPAPAPPESS